MVRITIMEEKGTDKTSTRLNAINNLVYTLKPALLLENFFGIYRFDVTESGFGAVHGRKKLLAIPGPVLIASISLYSIIEIPDTIAKYSEVVDIVDEIPTILILVQYIATVGSSLFFLNAATINMLNTFVELDIKLRINMHENFYSNCRALTIKNVVLLMAIHILFTFTDLITNLEDYQISHLITNMLLSLQQDMEIFIFCKIVSMLRRRLIIINKYLSTFVQENGKTLTSIYLVNEKDVINRDNPFNFIGSVSTTNMKIRDLASLYDTLGTACYLMNEVFKFQTFMNLVSTFSFIIITIWTSLYYFRTPESSSGELVTAVNWSLLTIVSVTVMAFTCEDLLTTRHETRLLVNEIIMNYNLPKTMREQAKVLMETIEVWPLNIYMYDMFSIDIKLLLKFVSVATTYLIVMIQISHFF